MYNDYEYEFDYYDTFSEANPFKVSPDKRVMNNVLRQITPNLDEAKRILADNPDSKQVLKATKMTKIAVKSAVAFSASLGLMQAGSQVFGGSIAGLILNIAGLLLMIMRSVKENKEFKVVIEKNYVDIIKELKKSKDPAAKQLAEKMQYEYSQFSDIEKKKQQKKLKESFMYNQFDYELSEDFYGYDDYAYDYELSEDFYEYDDYDYELNEDFMIYEESDGTEYIDMMYYAALNEAHMLTYQ